MSLPRDPELQSIRCRLARKWCGNASRCCAANAARARLRAWRKSERLDAHVDQTGDRAGRVVRVQGGENKMPGERRLNGDLRCLEIAGFADHDAVRVLAQKRAQDARKGQADGFVHRHLHDAFQIVFDRLFRGQEFGIDRVDLAQAGIKRRRFSGAGRAGDNEDAVRPLDHFEDVIVDVIGHAERFEIEIDGGAIEHAQDDAFAKLRRQSRDAQIDGAAGDVFLDAAVLRQAALGDVHVRHHFHARDNRQREMARRRRHFVKRAVDAITNFEFVFERLEMNVARAVLDRLVQDQIDKANDRAWRSLRLPLAALAVVLRAMSAARPLRRAA